MKSDMSYCRKTAVEQVISDFLFHCQYEKNLNEKTIYAYRSDLYMFNRYIHELYPSVVFEQVSKDMLKTYLQHISTYKPKTVKRKLASLKALFNYYDFEHDDFLNPFRKLRIRFKEPYVLPTVMTCNEVKEILKYLYKLRADNPDTGGYAYKAQTRDIAVVELLFATGIRVSELCELSCDAVDLKQATIKVFGKGSKERVIQICSVEVLKILRQYQRLFAPSKCFFINRLGNRLSSQSVRLLIKRCREEIGIGKKITPHSARHTFSTIMCRRGVPREDIIIATGHEDTQMLDKIYAHLTAKDKSRKVTTAFKKKLGDGIFDMGGQPEPEDGEQTPAPTVPANPKQKTDVFNYVFAGDLLLKLSRLKNKGIDITKLADTEEAVKTLKDVGRIDEIDKDKYKDNTRLRDKVAKIASVVWFIAFKRNDAVLIQMFQNNITELGLRNIFLNGEIMREARLESLMNGDEKVLKFVEVLNIRSMEELEEYEKRDKGR